MMMMTMMMMKNKVMEAAPNPQFPTTSSSSWKLYDNPIFSRQSSDHRKTNPNIRSLRCLINGSNLELGLARAEIKEMRSELQLEIKARKKAEFRYQKLVQDFAEEQKRRDFLKRECEELAKLIEKMRREIKEDRTESLVRDVMITHSGTKKNGKEQSSNESSSSRDSSTKPPALRQKPLSPEAQNPHIRRAMKGFVEFPRVLKAARTAGTIKRKPTGVLTESQSVLHHHQLRVMMKQSLIRSDVSPISTPIFRSSHSNTSICIS